MEDDFWQQISRDRWHAQGDRNIAFFRRTLKSGMLLITFQTFYMKTIWLQTLLWLIIYLEIIMRPFSIQSILWVVTRNDLVDNVIPCLMDGATNDTLALCLRRKRSKLLFLLSIWMVLQTRMVSMHFSFKNIRILSSILFVMLLIISSGQVGCY